MAKNEAPKKRDASDVYDRQIRLWGKEAQVSTMFMFMAF
jgi:hypothetical protein